MSPFPLGLDPPGRRVTVSSTQDRDPCRLAAIIAEHHFRGHARYARRDVDGNPATLETWCNLFAQDVAEALGVLLPRHTRANGLVEWLASPAARALGWEEVPQHVAQRQADEGQLAVVVWHSRGAGSGHIAVLVPALGEPGTWIAQAGLVNFTRGSLQSGFGTRAVTFFSHP